MVWARLGAIIRSSVSTRVLCLATRGEKTLRRSKGKKAIKKNIIVDLQCFFDFCCTAKRPSHTEVYPFFNTTFHHVLTHEMGHSSLSCTAESHHLPTPNLSLHLLTQTSRPSHSLPLRRDKSALRVHDQLLLRRRDRLCRIWNSTFRVIICYLSFSD